MFYILERRREVVALPFVFGIHLRVDFLIQLPTQFAKRIADAIVVKCELGLVQKNEQIPIAVRLRISTSARAEKQQGTIRRQGCFSYLGDAIYDYWQLHNTR